MSGNTEKIKQTQKWCPLARLSITDATGDHHSANRFYGTEPFGLAHAGHCLCIAEACAVFNETAKRCGLIAN